MPDARGNETPGLRGRHVDALDGVRAVAVSAVLVFHQGFSWAQGGFLGVEAFFVLSGFLITSLLIDEWRDSQTISVSSFWARRARRLLPALLCVIIVCAIYERLSGTRAVPDFGADVLATALYVANWHQIWTGSGYFAQTGLVSPLQHTWSLAIEEQFYIVWPLVVLGLLRLTRRVRVVAVVAVLGAAASAVEMALLFHNGAGLDRVYYGTDTRAQALLSGAALALVMRGWSATGLRSSRLARVAPAVAGLGALGGLVAMIAVANGSSSWLYRGGFLGVDVIMVALLASLIANGVNPVRWALSSWPLRRLGTISYGVYLWHFPLFVWLTAQNTGVTGNLLFVVRVAATLAASVASYVLVEQPVRRRRLPRVFRVSLLPLGTVLAAGAVALTWGVGTAAFAVGTTAAPHLAPRCSDSPKDTGCSDPRVMIIGDSLAVTLGVELTLNDQRYGVDVLNEARLGCGFIITGRIDSLGQGFGPLNHYCVTEIPKWKRIERAVDPQAIVVERGLWDELTWEQYGHVRAVGNAAYDRQLIQQMSRLVRTLGSPTVPVVFLSVPVVNPPPWPNGSIPPMASPVRNRLMNKFLRSMTTRFPTIAHFFSVSPYVTPGNHFSFNLYGQICRDSDGVHFYVGTSSADRVQTRCGAKLQAALLPYLRRLIAEHQT